MKVFGKLLADLGEIIIPASWRQLRLQAGTASFAYRIRLQHRLSPSLLHVLVVGEDHRFYLHAGFDPVAIAGALWRLIKSGKLSGASTIEQQLVRVLTGDRRRTVGRKAREIILACALSRIYEKAEIAGMYLAVAYFGWRMNGVEEACDRLSVNLSNITLLQAASLVARRKYPEPQYASVQRSALVERRTDHLMALLSARHVAEQEVGTHAALLDT
jgi:membrane peptidoglycan carboxypeptidase